MAFDPRQNVSPGDPLGLAASQTNWLNQEMRKPKGGGGAPILFAEAPFTRLKCKNNSGSDVPRGGVLKITGLAHDFPDEYGNPQQFTQFPVLAGTTPDASTEAWAIAVEPIKDGKVGDVATPPLVQAKINVLDADHTWTKPGTSVDELVSSWYGTARIFAKQTGTGTGKHALVQIEAPQPPPRVARFAGTWAKGDSKTVELCEWDGSEYVPVDPSVTFSVLNLAAAVDTPNVSSYGFLGTSFRGGRWVLDWFECGVAEV